MNVVCSGETAQIERLQGVEYIFHPGGSVRIIFGKKNNFIYLFPGHPITETYLLG